MYEDPSLSELSIQFIRLMKRLWPFTTGADFPNHLGAFAARVGLLKPVWFEFQPGLRMRLNIQELIHETILMEGLWDPKLTDLVKRRLNPGNVFVDIGAHSGYFTLLAAQKVTSIGKVVSVEPNPTIVKQLVLNIRASNLSNVMIEEVACSDSREPALLYVHDDSNSSMSSLSRLNLPEAPKVLVTCTTLDALVEKHKLTRLDLIKIDVEGAELSVLRGGSKTITQMKPTIVLELDTLLLKGFDTTFEDVVTLMDGLDYNVKPLGGHSNYICEPN